jgi:predicted transcriptional regulator
MTLQQIAQRLELTPLNPRVSSGDSREVGQAHASDLLSDVLANAPDGGLLLTIQVHLNVIAVAVHAGLSAVVFTSGLSPEQEVREKAAAEGLPLFGARNSTFEVAGKLYALGLRGRHG